MEARTLLLRGGAFLGASQTLVASFLTMIPAIPSNPAGAKLCSSYNLSFREANTTSSPTLLPDDILKLVRSWVAVASDRKTYMLCSPEE